MVNSFLPSLTQSANEQLVRLSDSKIRHGWRVNRGAVDGLQNIARFDARNMSGPGFKYVQEHPFSVTIQRHIAEACVDRMLRQQFFGKEW